MLRDIQRITLTLWQFHILLSLASLVPHDPRPFFPLTRYASSHVIVLLHQLICIALGRAITFKSVLLLSTTSSSASGTLSRICVTFSLSWRTTRLVLCVDM